MQPAGLKAYCFEGHTLDLRRGCLRKADREIDLRRKSFEVLRYLVENAGRLVSKDELIEAVWPSVVVTDESLTQCVSEVRLALGDGDQRVIKTAPRRGYIFTAPVSQRVATNIDAEPPPAAAGQVRDLGTEPAAKIHGDPRLPRCPGRSAPADDAGGLGGEQFR